MNKHLLIERWGSSFFGVFVGYYAVDHCQLAPFRYILTAVVVATVVASLWVLLIRWLNKKLEVW